MKIIFFILAAFLAIALAVPAPEAEAVAEPQYYLSDVYGDYGLDAYPEAGHGWLCRRLPWHPRCRTFGN